MAEDLSYEELLQLCDALTKQVDDQAAEIADLSAEQVGGRKSRGSKGGGGAGVSSQAELDALDAELQDVRAENDEKALTISNLTEELADAKVKITSLNDEKAALDKKVKEQNRRLDQLEKDVVEANSKSRSAAQESRDFNKQKEANMKEARRLFDENATLKEENEDYLEQLQKAVEERDMYDVVIARLEEEKEEEAHKVEAIQVAKDDLQEEYNDILKELGEAQDKYQAAMDEQGGYEQRIDQLTAELKRSTDKAAADARSASEDIRKLREQVAVLKDSTKLGEKQRRVEELEAEAADSAKLMEEMARELEEAVSERDAVTERLAELDGSIEQRVVERVAAERARTKKMELAIETLKQQNQDNIEHFQSLEDERLELTREVDELRHWKATYEAGHGLQELSRSQKRLKDDNRRLSVAVEQLTGKVGMAMDANGVLTQAFDRLKKECGKDPDFMYPEYELQSEVLSTNASQKAILRQLEEQVQVLEGENTRLRVAMKNQAASIGEDGFKYAGMTPDQLLQVNDFAAGLRDGRVELPLNDRSLELLKQNKDQRDQLQAAKLSLERLERELGGAAPGYDGADIAVRSGGVGGGAQLSAEDMQRLTAENEALHKKMNALQTDLTQLLQRGAGAGVVEVAPGGGEPVPPAGLISAKELSNILAQNNELVLQELEALRSQQVQAQLNAAPAAEYLDQPVHYGQVSLRNSLMLNAAAARGVGRSSVGSTTAVGAGGATPTPRLPSLGEPTPMRTPRAAGGRVPFLNTASLHANTNANAMGAAGPATPHGKQLLNNALSQLNLPPEEWALEVRDLNAQLVECLEQLYEREQELEDQGRLVSDMEEQLVGIKQQMTALYYDYAQRADAWEEREQRMKGETSALVEQRDDLALKLRRMQDMADLLQREDEELLQHKVAELTRKVTIYEVNEAVLTRRYIAQSEQLKQEQQARQRLETDFVEMEGALKKRILYLEQYKLAAGSRIGHLQTRVDASVTQADYLALQSELEVLREDHLQALRREVESRLSALKMLDSGRELRASKLTVAHLTADLEGARATQRAVEAELSHQKETTHKALAAAQSSAEVSLLVSEMARFRGEASRMEMELFASNRRAELLAERVQELSEEAEQAGERIKELERREVELGASESAARRAALDMQLTYEGGLTRAEAEELRAKLDKAGRALEEAQHETARHREIAEIATQQAQSLASFRKQNADELQELREYCTRLESRTEDELLIGRLQRQLMSTKSSYKAFVRKYQHARENMRKRELAMRILETRLDEQEKAVSKGQEASRLEVGALKKALRSMKNTVFEGAGVSSGGGVGFDDEEEGGVSINELRNKAKNGLLGLNAERAEGNGNVGGGEAKSKAKRKKRRTLAKSGFSTVAVGQKLLEVCVKVDDLAALAEDAVDRAAESEAQSRELAGAVEDLRAERQNLQERCQDLEALTRGKSKQSAIAARLIALSEDTRVSKIANLQQRRQIQILRQEKRHLQNIISNIEADVMELEEGKVVAETERALFDINEKTGLQPGEEFSASILDLGGDDDDSPGGRDGGGKGNGVGQRPGVSFSAGGKSTASSTQLSIDVDHLEPRSARGSRSARGQGGVDGGDMEDLQDYQNVSPEELFQKLKLSYVDLADTRRELSAQKVQAGSLMNRLGELEALVQERDGQVQYYERVLVAEGIPAVLLRNQPNYRGPPMEGGGGGPHHITAPVSMGSNRQYKMLQEEQQRLEEAASATIGSLRALLEEKNRVIEKYREKLDRLHMTSGGHNRTRAERHADELLDRIAADEAEAERARKYTMFPSATTADKLGAPLAMSVEAEKVHKQLLDQIDQADSIIAEKERLVAQLEQKLLAESNQRERAEVRCGDSLREMEAMREDMMTLVQQLQELEAKCAHLSKATTSRAVIPAQVDSTRTKDLERLVRAKDDKVKGYREIIVRLKEEFIKAEERQAAAEVRLKAREAGDLQAGRDSGRGAGAGAAITGEELRELKGKIAEMHEGLKQARAELDKARRVRERLAQEKREAEDVRDKMAEALSKAEAHTATAQGGYHRLRKELEESRKKEVRLREKLKELLHGEGGHGHTSETLAKARERMEHLEREVELLKAQNAALRKHEPGHTAGEGMGGTGGGHVLGAGTGTGAVDDVRQQLHNKWEAEKKLQKRLSVLEKRLQEKVAENEDLQAQVQRGRDTVQTALQAKEELQRKASSAARQASESRKATAEDLSELEKAHSKVFEMEEELVRLRRKAHVEQTNEINSLGHQVAVQRARIGELEADLAESERRRKQLSSAAGPGGGGSGGSQAHPAPRSLRESEDRFLREERLKDDLDLARRQKLELEAALLDRDARAMETRFDLEAAQLEVERLRRRNKELDAAYKGLSSVAGAGGGGVGGLKTGTAAGSGARGGPSSRKEAELEGVVEAMKRVVDKLKTENDRLKRSGAAGAEEKRAAEAERRLQAERKRSEKLEEENRHLQGKLKGHEDSSQKVVQRQQQVAQLRRQLKGKDDEVQVQRELTEAALVEREALKKKLTEVQARVNQLEIAAHQAQSQTQARASTAPGGGTGSRDGGREMQELRRTKDALQEEVEELRTQVNQLQRSGRTGAGTGAAASAEDVQRLREENKKLKAELSAFDLDFFEEIENLKFAHAEAMRKLRAYESAQAGTGRTGRLGGL